MSSLATRILCRGFVTSSRICAKPGYFIYKLLEKEPIIGRRKNAQAGQAPQAAQVIRAEATRRQRVLNALYLESITDILGMEFANELAEFKIQIHNVRILHNLKLIYVYWTSAESTVDHQEVAEVLKNIEPQIRKELSCVRHMGLIPKVKFIYYAGILKGYDVHSILDRLREAGELDGVEPAALPVKQYPQVYGLDRNKILNVLAARSLPADFLTATTRAAEGKLGPKEAKATADFVQKFRKSKSLHGRDLKDDRRWLESGIELVMQEQLENCENDYEDTDYEDDVDNDYYVDADLSQPPDEWDR